MISARNALQRLREGNGRFTSNLRGGLGVLTQPRRDGLPGVQEPFAIVLGCSDARVPAEIVFDQGLGDLFVIRVAGNIVAPSQVGSVEFAAARFGTRLVVVLGHSGCGAILATLEELRRPTENQSRNLRAIVDRVRPSVEGLLAAGLARDEDALVKQAVRANIRASADHLRHGSSVLEQLIQDDGLLVVGAEVLARDRRSGFLRRPAGGHRPLDEPLKCVFHLLPSALSLVTLRRSAAQPVRPTAAPLPCSRQTRSTCARRQGAGARRWAAASGDPSW